MRHSCRFRTDRTPSVQAVPRKPYRSPREWLHADQARFFGSVPAKALQWMAPQSRLEEGLLAAAQRQSDLAFTIRLNMTYDRGTSALAAFADLHADTVRDVLTGRKHVSLAAVHALTLGVGLDLVVSHKPADPTPTESQTP